MDIRFVAALFALASAATWGAGDFTGGIATRRVGPLQTILVAYGVGLIALVIVALGRLEPLPSTADLLWGAFAGLTGMVGLGFLFRGFAAGRMGIVAPVSAVLTAALPVVFAAFSEGLPRAVQFIGFVLAILSIWLLSRPEKLSGRPAGLGMAMLAGLGFGAFFILLDQISENAVFWPLAAGRLVSVVTMLAFALVVRRPLLLRPAYVWGLLVIAGILDVAGNLFFLLAVQSGRLDVTAVLSSLYPAVTALLAWVIAREAMTRLQIIGVVLAILAIVLITL